MTDSIYINKLFQDDAYGRVGAIKIYSLSQVDVDRLRLNCFRFMRVIRVISFGAAALHCPCFFATFVIFIVCSVMRKRKKITHNGCFNRLSELTDEL
jgi:hypothetical protein